MSFDEGAKRRLHELAAKLRDGPASAQTMGHDLTNALYIIDRLEAQVDAFDDAGLLCTSENIHGNRCILPGKHAEHFDGALYWKG